MCGRELVFLAAICCASSGTGSDVKEGAAKPVTPAEDPEFRAAFDKWSKDVNGLAAGTIVDFGQAWQELARGTTTEAINDWRVAFGGVPLSPPVERPPGYGEALGVGGNLFLASSLVLASTCFLLAL